MSHEQIIVNEKDNRSIYLRLLKFSVLTCILKLISFIFYFFLVSERISPGNSCNEITNNKLSRNLRQARKNIIPQQHPNFACGIILFLISATGTSSRCRENASPPYIREDILGDPLPPSPSSVLLSCRILRDALRQNADITATRRSIYHCARGGCVVGTTRPRPFLRISRRIYRGRTPRLRRSGIIIPSAELLAQLTGRLNDFKYSARCRRPAFVARSDPLGRSMEREICDGRRRRRRPSSRNFLWLYSRFYQGFSSPVFFFFFMKPTLHAPPTDFTHAEPPHELPDFRDGPWIVVKWTRNVVPGRGGNSQTIFIQW